MNPRLVGVAGPLHGRVFPISTEETTIGREYCCELHISDRTVSRRHCMVIAKDAEFSIRDLGSDNQTLVNGVPVAETRLQHGDQIVIGGSVLVFLLREDDTHLQRTSVEIADAEEVETAILCLAEDSISLPAENFETGLPPSARQAHDLNSLLRIATGIGRIRDRDSLQWQLLGLIFDVVPADRGAILLLKNGTDFSSVAWDRVGGPAQTVRVSRRVVQRVTSERLGLLLRDMAHEQSPGNLQ
jgi:two-component system response regulator HydG